MTISRRAMLSTAAIGGDAMVVPAHGKLLRARPDTIVLARMICTLNQRRLRTIMGGRVAYEA